MATTISSPIALVTGGTGLLGSHIAERLVRSGRPVRALVRSGSDTGFLERLGIELVRGDLANRGALKAAVRGVSTVYHAAAKVGDWGAWKEFRVGCLDATRNLAEAAAAEGVGRFVQISSTSAYGHPKEGGPPVVESDPLGQRLWAFWDDYTRSKVESERLLWELAERRGLPITVIRPSWLFGERDRTTTRRLAGRLRSGVVPLIGPGDNPLSAIYAGCVAEAAILAADDPGSVGEAYNVTDQGPITQREYLRLWTDALGLPPLRKRRRYGVVFGAAFVLEAAARLSGRSRPPLVTRYATWLMARRLSYSTAKARARLGWSPSIGYREAIAKTVDWLRNVEAPAASASG